MSSPKPKRTKSPWVIPLGQTLRVALGGLVFAFTGLLLSLSPASGQLYDALDAYPPRWHLDHSDCDARVVTHKHLGDGGVDGRGCELITMTASHGTQIVLAYPIEPVLPIDGLTANVSVMSALNGARIGLRVRYPYLRVDSSRQSASVIVYGTAYKDAGKYAAIGIGMIEKSLEEKVIALRAEHGSDSDLRDPYVDAVVINAYTGAGSSSLRIDELRVDGLVSVSDVSGATLRSASDHRGDDLVQAGRIGEGSQLGSSGWQHDTTQTIAFPLGRITRILQHNGEPLSWVRSLGFDAVLLSKPPDAAILGEAIRSRIAIYAPPPSSPDPSLQSLLQPVAGWCIGMNVALDSTKINDAEMTSRRLRAMPMVWQRPILAAPLESYRQYVPMLDAMIHDLPIRSRGVADSEEISQLLSVRQRVGDRIELATGVMSMPPERALRQAEAIADSIGAPRPTGFRWHSMWIQAMRSLQAAPSAIVFRSTRSLLSGAEIENQRSMALSYVNRMIAMIEPWASGATPSPPLSIRGAPYRCSRLVKGKAEVLILTSSTARGSEVLAGDGNSLELVLSPSDANKTMWRMTHFSAERLTPETTAEGARVEIVSPDAVEVIVVSSDPSLGSQLSQAANRFSRQAALDRWQLAGDLVRRTRDHWQTTKAARVTNRPPPMDLLRVATQSLHDAEPLYRAGETEASLRMARRADAWAMRSEWQLSETLMPDWPRPTSCPTIDCGATEVQAIWYPLMRDRGWSSNYLTTGSLDSADLIDQNRWTFGKRLEGRANSEVVFAHRGSYSGPGALVTRATSIADDPLPGGYEGTVLQVRSPGVRIPAQTAVRIDALVRTIGFGRPQQGILVYDNIGGQEMGVLVRGRSTWTPVRLYRQTTAETEVSVMFELMGDGEAMIDEVEIRIWQPSEAIRPPMPIRPIEGSQTGMQISSEPELTHKH
ncbi:hypothetical protein [Novipirellula artificiosorum]|uniref:Uncharacterized protein n=1 Tax=Novipirellula artificiosorum TaxID=2528016 RepID=A0A5C6E1X5_9BACT|nr:hypothetical protein [Novipirellula artificiosorum]TWU42494.1 hypothetical protein Poly41_07910 [Novipirellula artificiosorum]